MAIYYSAPCRMKAAYERQRGEKIKTPCGPIWSLN